MGHIYGIFQRMKAIVILMLLFFFALSVYSQSIKSNGNSDYLTPQILIDPDWHEAWMWPDMTHQWVTTISNLGTSPLTYNFPGFSTGSPPPGFITDVNPSSGILPVGNSNNVTVTWNSTGYPPGIHTQDLFCESNDPTNPVHVIGNIMHIFLPAYIIGTVIDSITQQPIPGVTVTVGIWQTQTLGDGSYILAVDAGPYMIYYDKMGYYSMTVATISIPNPGDTTVVDVTMIPMSFPVPWVIASVDCNDPEPSEVNWPTSLGYFELMYDDGSAEDYFAWASADGENAVKFTPSGYPANIFGGRLFVGDGLWPPGNWMGTEFAILIYDEGPTGLPGNKLDSVVVTVSNYGWIEFNGLDVDIDSNDFFISMKQLNPSPNTAPIGVDTDPPTVNRSYSKMPGGSWGVSVYQDFMIRAFVNEQTTTPVDNYTIARISDFDPNVGPASGTMTMVADTLTNTYIDSAFQYLPEAWYCYAIQANYSSGIPSPWTYSNIMGMDKGKIVTFEIFDCLNGAVEGAEVLAQGFDWPYEEYEESTDSFGICQFECMWAGNYEINISKYGYIDTTFTAQIGVDTIFVVMIEENLYSPRNLWVDSVTGTANWDEPLITAFYDDFDELSFLSNGWQMFSSGVGWQQTDDGGSAGFFIMPNGSTYACVNDDLAGPGNNGCCDLLITPELDLRDADNYKLCFDSYYTGVNGQLASVEYSLDAGASWMVLYSLSPASGVWEYIEIDISSFSGATAQESIWFAFHADDDGNLASGWAIDNIDIHAGSANVSYYHVFLDGNFLATTDTTYYEYSGLSYGIIYESCVGAFMDCGLSELSCEFFTSGYLAPPSLFEADTLANNVELLWIYDTASITGIMPEILGFNVYRDSTNIAFIAYTGEDTNYYTDMEPDPMCYDYYVSALYEGLNPGDTVESAYTGPEEVCLVIGAILPYFQDWSTGSFEPFWTPGGNWVVNGQIGNYEPSAEFKWDPILNNYEECIVSGYINGVYPETKSDPYTDGKFMLGFDLYLANVNPTGNEHFYAEVWSEGTWYPVMEFNNANGSFEWTEAEVDITEYAMGNVFKIRFIAVGEVSSDILSWFVDNIEVYHYCAAPVYLNADWETYFETIRLEWQSPGDVINSKEDITLNSSGHSQTGIRQHEKEIVGYNIYLDIEGSGFEYLDYTEDTSYLYYYTGGDIICFYVTSVFESCESEASDMSCVWLIGVEENNKNLKIKVFPNPTNSLLNIESSVIITQVCLIDYSGRLLECRDRIEQKQTNMNVSSYETGIYLLRIDTEVGRFVRKVVIE